ncbi:MAG: tetratricopeptide repeat protein [Sphingomicrobium sp.]
MLALLIAAAIASGAPGPPLAEAAHAIAAGRLDQARMMIANAVAAGASAASVERLLADLAFASGNSAEALARYEKLLAQKPADAAIAERAGIAALKLGKTARATALLNQATASPQATWRGWNARGVTADLRRDWDAADAAYAEAARRSPDQPELLNNMGWSQLLRGNWADALALLTRAAERDPDSTRAANNLELATAALANDLPRRRARESDGDWAARLNDAGVAAHLLGDDARATAAFARAIEARTLWYERAANNLKLVEAAR